MARSMAIVYGGQRCAQVCHEDRSLNPPAQPIPQTWSHAVSRDVSMIHVIPDL